MTNKLDAEVAEKVMGWSIVETKPRARYDNIWIDSKGDFAIAVPRYSMWINEAILVFDEMKRQRPELDFMLYECIGWNVGTVLKTAGTIEIDDCLSDGDNLTLPEAICTAAIELLGGCGAEVEGEP